MKAAPWTCTASCREQPMMIVFYVASAVAIVSTALMITRLHAVHALLYLIVSLLAVSVVFYTLGAPFIAALEVIVYAGAIMVLFVLVVRLLTLGEQAAQAERALLNPPCGPGLRSLRSSWWVSFSTCWPRADRKSTRLNSSHLGISYAVFCLKK